MAYVTVVVCFIVSVLVIDVTLASDNNAVEVLTLRIKRLEERDEIQQKQITRSKILDDVMQIEIDSLKECVDQLQNRIKTFEKRDEEHQNPIKRLEENEEFLRSKKNRLEKNSEDLKDKIAKFEERVELRENKIKHHENHDERMYDTVKRPTERDEAQQQSTRILEDVSILQREQHELQFPLPPQWVLTSSRQQTAALKGNTRKTIYDDRMAKFGVSKFLTNTPVYRKGRAEPNDMGIAFFATLSSNQMHVGVHQSILFDNVITNIGNGYHSHVGTFIAPVSGTYVFSVTLFSGWSQAVDYVIMKNANSISRIYNNAGTSGDGSGSQTLILQLIKNDDIVIHNINLDKYTIGNHYSTFAGFLLRQHFQAETIG